MINEVLTKFYDEIDKEFEKKNYTDSLNKLIDEGKFDKENISTLIKEEFNSEGD